jgi:hypothetical protein
MIAGVSFRVVMGVVAMPMVVPMIVVIIGVFSRMMPMPGMRARSAPPAPETGKLGRQQPDADHRDQGVAHALQLVRPGIDLEPRCMERKDEHADEGHGGQRLQTRRNEGDDHPPPHGLLIGDYVRRDDRLAVARADCMHHAINEAEDRAG